MILGGGVKGKQILGQYPPSVAKGSEHTIKHGRTVFPTVGWESVWNGVAEWLGVESSDMQSLLPNAANFASSQIFTKSQMFD